MVFPLISDTADLRPSIRKNNHRAQKMVFSLISHTADHEEKTTAVLKNGVLADLRHS